MLNKGNRWFTDSTTYNTGGTSNGGLTVGDFNGDNVLDLAVTNYGSQGSIGILLGKGNGTFSAATTFSTVGISPYTVIAKDFNGDRILDLVVTDFVTSGTVEVYLGTGNGTFASAATYSSGGSYPSDVTVGDFNDDGKIDLAVLNSTSHTIEILIGNGLGRFSIIPTTFRDIVNSCVREIF